MQQVHPTSTGGKRRFYWEDKRDPSSKEHLRGYCQHCGLLCLEGRDRLGDTLTGQAHAQDKTYLSVAVNSGDTTVNVDSTAGFASSGSATIYDQNGGKNESFNYTGVTSTSFTGVTGITESFAIDDVVRSPLKRAGGCPLCGSKNWRWE